LFCFRAGILVGNFSRTSDDELINELLHSRRFIVDGLSRDTAIDNYVGKNVETEEGKSSILANNDASVPLVATSALYALIAR